MNAAEIERRQESAGKSGRWVVVVTIAVVVAVVGYLMIAMPGMDHGSTNSMGAMDSADMDSAEMDSMAGMGNEEPPVDMSPQAASPIAQADPAEFELLMSTPDTFVVNVHIPDQGNIRGTDVSIPYEGIVGDPRLPADLETPILLYCETGRMSAIAGAALAAAGYSDVTELAGGMQAWQASGRSVESGS